VLRIPRAGGGTPCSAIYFAAASMLRVRNKIWNGPGRGGLGRRNLLSEVTGMRTTERTCVVSAASTRVLMAGVAACPEAATIGLLLISLHPPRMPRRTPWNDALSFSTWAR
jgi:hypothetical protein